MPKSIQERVRAAQAAADKARKAIENKATEPERRAIAARFAVQARRDKHIDDLIDGRIEARTAEDFRILDRAEFGDLC